MGDLVDEANETADLFLRAARAKRKIEPTPEGTGSCLNCAAELDDARRWCDLECQSDYLRAKQTK